MHQSSESTPRKPLKVYFYKVDRAELAQYEKHVQKIAEGRVGKAAGLDSKHAGGNSNTVFTLRDNQGDRLLFIRFRVDGEPRLMFIKVMKHKGYQETLFTKKGLRAFLEKHVPEWTAWVQSLEAKAEALPETDFEEDAIYTEQIAIDWEKADWIDEQLMLLNLGQEAVIALPVKSTAIITGPAGSGKTSTSLLLLEQCCNMDLQEEKLFLYLTDSSRLKASIEAQWESMGGDTKRVHFKTFNTLLEENIPDCRIVGYEDFACWLETWTNVWRKQNPKNPQVNQRFFQKEYCGEIYAEIQRIADLSLEEYNKLGVRECHFHETSEKEWLFNACTAYKKTLYPNLKKPELKQWIGDFVREYRENSRKNSGPIKVSEAFLKNTNLIYQECDKAMTLPLSKYQTGSPKISTAEKEWIIEICRQYRENKVHPAFYDQGLKTALKGRYAAVVFDEAQKCSLHQLTLAGAMAEFGRFYLMDTNQSTDANTYIHEALRKRLLAQFSQNFRQIELPPCCYRSHPLILDCFLNPVLRVKGEVCGLDYKGKYSWVNGTDACNDAQDIFSRIEVLDPVSLEKLQKMTASCAFAVMVATETARQQAIALFGETAVYRIAETAGLEFDQVLLFDCFNQPELQETAKLLQEIGKASVDQEKAMQPGHFHRAAAGMEGRESVALYFRNLYLAASRARKGLQIYQPPGHACNRILAWLQDRGMPKETRPIFEKLEASTPEAWKNLMQLLIRDHKIERAWSIHQDHFGKNRAEFDTLCKTCLQEAVKVPEKAITLAKPLVQTLQEAPAKTSLKTNPLNYKPARTCTKKSTTPPAVLSDSLPVSGKTRAGPKTNPLTLEDYIGKPERFANELARNYFWQQKTALHFPDLQIEDIYDWEEQFLKLCKQEYYDLSPEAKPLFSLVKEEDNTAFLKTNPSAKILHEKDCRGYTLIDWINKKGNTEKMREHCYKSANQHISNSQGTRNGKRVERLLIAVICGQLDEVKRQLGDNMANAFGKSGETPLCLAARYKYIKIIECLIKGGAKVNTLQRNESKDSVLHVAAEKGYLEIGILLLNNDADITLTNAQGKTAEDLAKAAEHQDFLDLLEENITRKKASTNLAKKPAITQCKKMPPSLEKLLSHLKQKKIRYKEIDYRKLPGLMKDQRMLPDEKAMNRYYDNNESGWFKLSIILKTGGEKLFLALFEAGIRPSGEALATCRISDNTNAWWWLTGFKRIPGFMALLENNIFPDLNAMNICRKSDNTNAWYWIARLDAGIPILLKLLENNILPRPEDLNLCSVDNRNTWSELAKSEKRIPGFMALLKKNIQPSLRALNICSSLNNTNTWYSLSETAGGSAAMLALFEKNILPARETLSIVQGSENINVWFILAGHNDRIPVFMALLEKNILPPHAALHARRSSDNSNTWYWLTKSDQRIPVLMQLFEKNILPNREDLDARCKTDNTNVWWNLATTVKRLSVLTALLEKNILPEKEALNPARSTDNVNFWWWLAFNEGIHLWMTLLEKNILPDKEALDARFLTDNTNVWMKLAASLKNLPVLMTLVEKNILPDKEALNARSTTGNINFWCSLAREDDCMPLWAVLLKKNVLPDKEALHALQSKNGTNVWWNLASSVKRLPGLMALLEKNILPEKEALNVRCSTDNTNTWWRLAYADDSIPIWMALMEKNILPDKEALDTLDSGDNRNAWWWLIADGNRTAGFMALLEKNILPDPAALRVRRNSSNVNCWWLLAASEVNMPGLITLLEKNILPDSEALNACRYSDNINFWFLLACNHQYVPVWMLLLEKNILPTPEALAACRSVDNVNTWFQLAQAKETIPVLIALLEKNILPDREALSISCKTDDTNIWYWLAGDDGRLPGLMALLEKNILPNPEALDRRRSADNTNAWWWLASSSKRFSGIMALLEKNILPSPEALNACHIKDNVNTWWWLTNQKDRIPVLKALLEKNIFPSPQALSACYTTNNTNAWFGLSSRIDSIPLFMDFLEKNILPESEALNVCSSTNANVWSNLADLSIPLFQNLLSRNILPDDKALNITRKDTVLERNVWCMLARTAAGTPVLEMLLNAGRVLQTKITLKTVIHLLASRNLESELPLLERLNLLLADFREYIPETSALRSKGIFNFPEHYAEPEKTRASAVYCLQGCMK